MRSILRSVTAAIGAVAGSDAPSVTSGGGATSRKSSASTSSTTSHSTISSTSSSSSSSSSSLSTTSSSGGSASASLSLSNSSASTPFNSELVVSAAQTLTDAIQEILGDPSSLSGDNTEGFERLLTILESEDKIEDVGALCQSRGIGCLQILLDNLRHSKFVETCNQVSIATAMMHALRLLRMYEIKQGKSSNRESLERNNSTSSSVTNLYSHQSRSTFESSQRLCKVFAVLCSDVQTIEKLRQSLVKLVTFPLSVVSEKGLHLQEHSANVLSKMCSAGLTSQQVWFLHDADAMKHMIRFLNELMSLEMEAQTSDGLLRGIAAEKAGMWLVGIDCLVNLITATVPVASVLMGDFETAQGYKLMVHFLEHTAPERLLKAMSSVTRLFFNPKRKFEDPLSFPAVGTIFVDLLTSILGLRRCVSVDDGIEKLIAMSQHLSEHAKDTLNSREYIIQNIAYTLLTLYSNDPRDCNVLEETHHLLPTLIVSLPALTNQQTISAILTTLNYVCQCVESAATLPIIALCASSTVIASNALNNVDDPLLRQLFTMQLDLTYSSFDAIIRSNTKFANLVLRSGGFLKHLICKTFENLLARLQDTSSSSSSPTQEDLEGTISIYVKVIEFLISVQRRSQYAADAVRQSGLQNVIHNLVVLPSISPDFVSRLLRVFEEVAKSGTSHLEESMLLLIDAIEKIKGQYLKIRRIVDCLSRVVQGSEEAPQVWRRINGFDALLRVLTSMEGIFTHADQTQKGMEDTKLTPAFDCLQAVMNFIALEMTLSSFTIYDVDYDSLYSQSRKFNYKLANTLIASGIFSSPSSTLAESCLLLVFELVNGRTGEATIVNPLAVEVALDLLLHLHIDLAIKTVELLGLYAENSLNGTQQLSEAGIVTQLIVRFHHLFWDDSHPLGGLILLLVRTFMGIYVTLDDIHAYLYYVVRADIVVESVCGSGGRVEGEGGNKKILKLMSPWQAFDASPRPYASLKDGCRSWDSLQFLVDLANKVAVSKISSPHVALGDAVSTNEGSPAHLSIVMSEVTKSFPSSSFTLSAWCKLSAYNDSMARVIPIVSLSSPSYGGCFFEAHLDVEGHFLKCYVTKAKGGKGGSQTSAGQAAPISSSSFTSFRFESQTRIDTFNWNSIVISFKQQKKLFAKNNLSVYFNGIAGIPSVNPESIDLNLSIAASQSVDVVIGKFSLPDMGQVPTWHLGPMLLYEEILTQNQISCIFMKGPTYTGTFSAESPLSDSLATVSCDLLHRCNIYSDSSSGSNLLNSNADEEGGAKNQTNSNTKNNSQSRKTISDSNGGADTYIENLGLRGLEVVVKPVVDQATFVTTSLDVPILPPPLLAYSAYDTITAVLHHSHGGGEIPEYKGKQGLLTRRSVKTSLLNSSSSASVPDIAEKVPVASLINAWSISTSQSIPSFVSSLGGPAMLMPLLQAASTVRSLCQFFQLLTSCVRENTTNLKYMQNIGYKVCAFILTLKPKSILTREVLAAIYDLCISKQRDDETGGSKALLLVDTPAIFYLVLNHQVWDAKRFPFVIEVLKLIVALLTDPKYGHLNAKRLSSLGVSRWALLLGGFGATLYCEQIEKRFSSSSSSSSSTSSSSSNDQLNDWHINCQTAEETANENVDKDEFLYLIISVVYEVMRVDIRKRDLDLVANLITFTCVARATNSASSTSTKSLREVSTFAQRPISFKPTEVPVKSSSTLQPIEVLRVYLLRLLCNLYDYSSGGLLFRSSFTSEWCLSVIERSSDDATKAHFLRFLGMMILRDASFQKDFSNKDGFKALDLSLAANVNRLPVILPLLAVFFRIPMSIIPYPCDVKESSKVVDLLDLEECPGPDISEPVLTETTLPVLAIIFDCLSNCSKIKEPDEQMKLQNDIVLGMFEKAIASKPTFRQLMQHKTAIEMLSSSTLNWSNAVDGFGSHIFINTKNATTLPPSVGSSNQVLENSPRLSESLQEDYIPGAAPTGTRENSTDSVRDGGLSAYDPSVAMQDSLSLSANASSPVASPKGSPHKQERASPQARGIVNADDDGLGNFDIQRDLTLVSEEGRRLSELITSSIFYAINEYRNSSIVCNYLLYFPQNLTADFVFGFQKVVLDRCKAVVDKLFFTSAAEPSSLHTMLQTVSALFIQLIPLVKARIICNMSLFELLKFSMEVFTKTTSLSPKELALNADKFQALLKEFGSTARYFATCCVHAANNNSGASMILSSSSASLPSPFSTNMRVATLQCIRLNLQRLSMKGIDDITEIPNQQRSATGKKDSLEDKAATGSVFTVLETFQLPLSSELTNSGFSSTKRTFETAPSSSSLTLAQSDKHRVSSAFCMSLFCNCLNLIMDDDDAVRLEAARVLALLMMSRRPFMDTMLASISGKTLVTSSITQKKNNTSDDAASDNGTNGGSNSSKEIDVLLRDGLLKLVPSQSAAFEAYSQFLKGKSDAHPGEQERMAEFSNWFSSNSRKTLVPFDNYVIHLAPVPAASSDVCENIRQIQSLRSKEDAKAASTARLLTLLKKAEEGQRLGNQILTHLKRWNIFGLVHIANGSLLWKKIWNALQSGPLWGYLLIPPDSATQSIISLMYSGHDSWKDVKEENEERQYLGALLATKSWKLDNTEGAERTRKRLEQDYSVPISYFADGDAAKRKENATVDPSMIPKASQKLTPDAAALENEDLEGFLKEIAKKGLKIKRVDSHNANAASLDDDVDDVVGSTDDDDPDVASEVEGVITKDRTMFTSETITGGGVGDRSNCSSPVNVPVSSVKLSSDGLSSFDGDGDDLASSSTFLRSQSPQLGVINNGTSSSGGSGSSSGSGGAGVGAGVSLFLQSPLTEFDDAKKSYMLIEIVKGIVGPNEWATGKAFNIQRIYGLEAQPGILILSSTNLHILAGFRLKQSRNPNDKTLEWKSSVGQVSVGGEPVQVASSNSLAFSEEAASGTSASASGSKDLQPMDAENRWLRSVWRDLLESDFVYQKMPLDEVYSIFKRRYQLKNSAMEITDTTGYSLLFSCESVTECNDVLLKLMEAELPASIFYRVIGLKNLELLRGLSNMYNRLMAMFVSKITKMWQHGELSNFEYLMHLNAAAGRSFQDLTQYPVFPWILADYSSDTLDLNDHKTFRDLSKPMGAIGARRAKQYKERYRTMDEFKREGIDATPPFYYGTHYSCAGYVLHYLLRLQPYSNMAVALQGGHFDKPDRLFLSIEHSWKSASQDNLQDVRELTPEFFYLPEFFVNSNNFDLGFTQKGEKVHDVQLPKWAHGDPKEFVRLHREALESKYVSENLHSWIDLIFGFKQRGTAAEEALNVFIHLTYDGEVDIDAISDPVLRDATIAQINNFGQTPSKIFNKPHPKKIVPDTVKRDTYNDNLVVDTYALAWHEHVSPPLCVVGAPEFILLNKVSHYQVTFAVGSHGGGVGGEGPSGPVGDMRLLSKDRLVAVPMGSLLLSPGFKRVVRFGNTSGGISIHNISSSITAASMTGSSQRGDTEKDAIASFESLHHRRITCVVASKNGNMLATGSEDMSVRLWNLGKLQQSATASSQRSALNKIEHLGTCWGHTGKILCIDMSLEYEIVVSGSNDRTACVWDTRTIKLLRVLGPKHTGPVVSVSISSISGNIASLTSSQLRLYTLNGVLLASYDFAISPTSSLPSSSPPSPSSHLTPAVTAVTAEERISITPARVVLAPPCAEWQDGVVAVTGHENGFIYLWKVKTSIDRSNDKQGRLIRTLVPTAPAKTHRGDITSLRLCPTVFSKSKEIVERSFDDAGSLDLLVGDADGFVSRWTSLRLEQLPQTDLQNVLQKHVIQNRGGAAENIASSLESISLSAPMLLRKASAMMSSVGEN